MLSKSIVAIWLAWVLTTTGPVFQVVRVIDGDTLLLSTGERVRLIGVDTPELYHPLKPVQYFAKEASQFTRKMAEGKRVRLEYDWRRLDRYNRLLAYVYLEDGTFLNAEIIRQGYGFAYTKYHFKYREEFRQYEREARENKRGLWKQRETKSREFLLNNLLTAAPHDLMTAAPFFDRSTARPQHCSTVF
jgi:endonuclease YncB( thermonuclease family)